MSWFFVCHHRWLLFGVFVLTQAIVERGEGFNFTMQGFALINVLVFAKVMMVFEMFDPGRWLRRRPLIYPIVYEAPLLTALFIIVHVPKKIIEGLIHGKTAMESIPSFGGGLTGLLSASTVIFVALVPFFGLRNLDPMNDGRGATDGDAVWREASLGQWTNMTNFARQDRDTI